MSYNEYIPNGLQPGKQVHIRAHIKPSCQEYRLIFNFLCKNKN